MNDSLSDDGQFRRGAQEQRVEALFAVRPGIDGLLDVARGAYHNTISNMKQYVCELDKLYPEFQIRLSYSARRGYHLRIPRKTIATIKKRERNNDDDNRKAEETSIPPIFIRKAFHKAKVECSTEDLEQLNSLQEQAAGEAFKRTKGNAFIHSGYSTRSHGRAL